MRRLGQALGADPSAVYRYYRSMEDLRLALGDRLIGETMAGFVPDPADWRASLRDFGVRAYRSAQRHPRAALLSGFRVTRLPDEQRAVDTGIGLLRAAGFSPRDAVRHYHVFVDTVLGHAALDAALQGLRPEQREADGGGVGGGLRGGVAGHPPAPARSARAPAADAALRLRTRPGPAAGCDRLDPSLTEGPAADPVRGGGGRWPVPLAPPVTLDA